MKRPPGKDMLDRVRHLRREMTPQEKLLWAHLRARRLNGTKFRKQMWLGGYIADFACPEARLVVEADGGQHADDVEYDRARAFERLAWRTLRFWNNEINENLEGVLTAIASGLPSPSHLPSAGGPLPLPEAGEGARGKVARAIPSPSRGEGGAQAEGLGG